MNEQSKKQKIIRLFLGVCVIIFILVTMWLIGRPLVHFVSDPEKFRDWVSDKGVWGIIVFIILNVLQVILAIIPGGPFEVGAGYAFGIVKGTLICDFAMTLGSILTFLLTKKFGIRFATLFFSKEKLDSLKFLKTSPKSKSILFLFFLIPGTPKDLMSYFVGLTDLKILPWIFINFVGRFPAILLSVIGGSALGQESYKTAVGLIIILIVLYIIGALIYNYYTKKHGQDAKE